jgi:adenylosuccinate lyase
MLRAISPIDGRYAKKTEALAEYFSEYALIKYRVKVEIAYLIALTELDIPQITQLKSHKKVIHRKDD